MKLVVGLGNPGLKYRNTKHNAGFWVIDSLAKHCVLDLSKRKFNAQYTQAKYAGEKFMLVKPLTFMNLSGLAVKSFIDFFKIDPANELLVVLDDVSLNVGDLRIKSCGSNGGHNGLRSIIESLGSDDFARLRVGIFSENEKSQTDLSEYVLGGFRSLEDKKKVKEAVELSAEAVLDWIKQGVDFTMNQYNKKRR